MNIVDLVKNQLGDEFAGAAAGALGLGAERTRSTIDAAVPAVLAGIVGSSSTRSGRDALGAALDDQDPGLLGRLSTALSGSGQQSLIGSGIEAMSSVLGGGKLAGLARGLGSYAGVDEGSAKSLIGLVAPVVLGVLGRERRSRNLDTDGLISTLQSQKSAIANAMPSGLARALGSTGLLDGFDDVTQTASAAASGARVQAQGQARRPAAARTAPSQERRGSRWGWIAAAIAGLAIIGWLLTRDADRGVDVDAPQARIDDRAPAAPPADAGRAGAASMVVGGVDVGRQFTTITERLSETMGEVRDGASAEAALPQLSALNDQLDDLAPLAESLPADAKPAFEAMARGRVAELQEEAARITSMQDVPEGVRQTVAELRDKLEEFVA